MHHVRRALIGAVSILSAAALSALSLAEIPAIISNNSLDLRKKRIAMHIQGVDVGSQWMRFLPDITASGSYDLAASPVTNAQSVSAGLSSTLSIGKDLFVGQAVDRLLYENARIAYEQFNETTLYETIAVYIDVLKDKLSVEIALSNEQISRTQYEFVKSKKQSGNASELDLINALAEYDNDVYTTQLARITLESTIARLKQQLLLDDIESVADVELPLPFEPIALGPGTIPANARGLSAMRAASNALAVQEITLTSSVLDRFVPTVTAAASADWKKHTYYAGAWTRNRNIDVTLSLAFSLPLWDRNVYLNKMTKSMYAVEQAKADIELARRTALKDITENIKLHNNRIELIPISQKRLKSAELNYKMMSESYRLGVRSLIDFYVAEKRFREAKRDFSFLQYDILLLKAKIGLLLDDTYRYLPRK
ncbi:MAG: TolC family protein [Spirochaetota bacterium]